MNCDVVEVEAVRVAVAPREAEVVAPKRAEIVLKAFMLAGRRLLRLLCKNNRIADL